MRIFAIFAAMLLPTLAHAATPPELECTLNWSKYWGDPDHPTPSTQVESVAAVVPEPEASTETKLRGFTLTLEMRNLMGQNALFVHIKNDASEAAASSWSDIPLDRKIHLNLHLGRESASAWCQVKGAYPEPA